MANKLQIKRTTTTGRTPNTTNSANTRYIDAGELALNLTDSKMFSSNGTAYFEIGSNVDIITVNKIVANGSLGNTTNRILVADATGNVSWNPMGSFISQNDYVNSFTGNGSNTVFSLSNGSTTNNAIVTINGVVQQPTTVYSISGQTLTLTSAPLSGDLIVVQYNLLGSATGTPAQYKYFRYTASNNQTSFSGGDVGGNTLVYTVGYETTHLNGVKLVPSVDYTANTGTSIVLTSGAANNDVVEIESFAYVYLTGADLVLTQGVIGSNNLLTSSVSQVSCDSYSTSLYRTAKYVIQITDNTNLDYHAADAMVTHNGTSAFIAVYGEVYSNVSLGTFDADINTGNVRLLVTPVTANSTIKIIRQTMVI